MLDERVRAVLDDTPLGRFLFALVAPQSDCGVLEIGPSATVWLAAGVRYFSGRVVTIGGDDELRTRVADAGLEDWVDFADSLDAIDDVFDVVVIAPGEDAAALFPRVRELVEPAALIVSASPLDHPALLSVDVPVGPGVEVSVVLE